MKTKTLKLYRFSELPQDVQQKVLEKLWDINVDYDWHEWQYDNLKQVAEKIGIEVNLKNTYFSGFGCQGSGASGSYEIDVKELIKAIQSGFKDLLEYAPKIFESEGLSIDNWQDWKIDNRVIKLISAGLIDVSYNQESTGVRYGKNNRFWFGYYPRNYFDDYSDKNYDNIHNQGERIENWLESVCDSLDSYLYRGLEKEYEYLTSKEAIIEMIEINEYYFDLSGNIQTPD